jgi:hypothetical protein
MIQLLSYYGDVIQVAVAALTIVLTVVSVRAYRKRPESRYLLLMLAFVSLCIISVTTMSLELFVGGAPMIIPLVELYVLPSFELLMVISFLVAITRPPRVKKRVVATREDGPNS